MPRRPDPDLEAQILKAARMLWKKGGDKALTMRAVAQASGTNTPAVYRRFRHRDDILRALLQRVRVELAAVIESVSSPEEACECGLDYALSHPREYQLFFQKEYELFHSPRSGYAGSKPSRPAQEAVKRKLAEKLGGSPEDHGKLAWALFMIVHGAAMLMIAKTILPKDAEQARAVFTASVAALLRNGLV
jgi:AcrR family transcriptional regulator